MYILDTDHLSIQDQDTISAFKLGRRLAAFPENEVVVTIVSYEEQMRGWLAFAARAKSPKQMVNAYRKLRLHVEKFREIPIIDFDDRAAFIFSEMRKSSIRIGSPDLRIASIALANDATLLTRNLSDFLKVPGLRAEDWSV
jgi:tRNA(fMet)-specific endonuclease VapC